MTSYRTSLGRARGMGSAKHGVSHYIAQRVSAMACIAIWRRVWPDGASTSSA